MGEEDAAVRRPAVARRRDNFMLGDWGVRIRVG